MATEFRHEGSPQPLAMRPPGKSDVMPATSQSHGHDMPSGSLLSDVDCAIALVPGEEGRDEMAALATLAHVTSGLAGHIVTVGAGQRTATVLGGAARAAGRSRVFAIDLFTDSEDAPDDAALSLDGFLATMTRSALLEHVLPHHGTAATFAQLMPTAFRARLILLDGPHACTNVETDVFVLEQFLIPGGWLCATAEFSSFPGAERALGTLFRQRDHFDSIRQIAPGLLAARRKG
jgi:methyltransferase family protein